MCTNASVNNKLSLQIDTLKHKFYLNYIYISEPTSQNIHGFFVKNNKPVIYIYNNHCCLLYCYFRIVCNIYHVINYFVESTLNA